MQHEFNVNMVLMVFIAGLLILASGCSTNRATPSLTTSSNIPYALKDTKEASWWSYKFKITWPENKAPDGVFDLFLAHAVVAPVLSEHAADISYWRFHRRAARDEAGHRFSFLFYCRPDAAFQIFEKLDESRFLKKAMAENFIERVTLDDYDYPRPASIKDTSDVNWPLELQRNWPSFIMGSSALWLGLISEYVEYDPDYSGSVSALLEKYREAERKITLMWRNDGQHALLHHLNAIFGYTPILIRKEMRF